MKIPTKSSHFLRLKQNMAHLIPLNRSNAQLKSLLIVGLPRGFTSQSYRIARKATGLKQAFMSAGEILNYQRHEEYPAYWMLREPAAMLSFKKFAFWCASDQAYEAIRASLDQIPSRGFVFKDVCFPQLVHRYISQNPDWFNVVFIRRDPRKVAVSIKTKGWKYPAETQELIREIYSNYPFIDADKAIFDHHHIPDILHREFGYRIRYSNYISPHFKRTRDLIEQKYEK